MVGEGNQFCLKFWGRYSLVAPESFNTILIGSPLRAFQWV